MTGQEFAERARSAAAASTLYVNGCFGAPLTASAKKRYTANNKYNQRPERAAKIYAATSNTFGFDCCGLVKAILWGWCADLSKVYGGAVYKANGVPDTNEDGLLQLCTMTSADFRSTKLVPGAYLYTPGHCGIYLGTGLAAEATPLWADGVQITAVGNIQAQQGYNTRSWSSWGLLPWIDYSAPDPLPENVKEFYLLCNDSEYTARGIYEAGNWYMRLRDLEDRLHIATVDYSPSLGLPVIKTK